MRRGGSSVRSNGVRLDEQGRERKGQEEYSAHNGYYMKTHRTQIATLNTTVFDDNTFIIIIIIIIWDDVREYVNFESALVQRNRRGPQPKECSKAEWRLYTQPARWRQNAYPFWPISSGRSFSLRPQPILCRGSDQLSHPLPLQMDS